MMNWKGPSVVAVCVALIVLLFVVTEVDARRGGRGRSISTRGPASGGSLSSQKMTRNGNRQGARSNRSENKTEARDDRQDRYDDRNDRYDDRRDDRQDYYEDRRRRRLGIGLTHSAFRSLSCNSTTVVASGVTYYRCGNDWYSRAYQGSSVTYVVVAAPAGY